MLASRFFLHTGIALFTLALSCNRANLGNRICDDPVDCPDQCEDPATCPEATIVGIVVSPNAPVLNSEDGSQPTQQFLVYGLRQDGGRTSKPLTATFAAPSNSIGGIDSRGGLFMASGEVGGTVMMSATASSNDMLLRGNFQITVNITRTYYTPGTPSDAGSRFSVPPVIDAAKSAQLRYPLDGVVMPQNVYPADIQWQNGVAGDFYKVTIRKPNITLTAYSLHKGSGYTYDYLPEGKGWIGITQSNPDDDALLSVDRYEALSATVYSESAPIKMHFAAGSLLGSIYYWDIAAGRIRRIDDGTANRFDFMPSPPTSPLDGSVCVGCHAVSRDGRYMLGRLGGGSNVAGVFDLTRDLTPNPAPSEYPISAALPQFFISSWNNDNTRIVGSNFNQLMLMDPKNGMSVAPISGTLPSDAAYPNWSPDGKNIAYISSANDWGGAVTAGNLSVLPVPAPDTFGTPRLLHAAGSIPGATTDTWPTWTPDGKWLAFHNGTSSRSDDKKPGALYLIDPNGNNLVRLSNATGGANNEAVFVPNFSPFNKGGYYWLTFITHRPYGNAAVGTAANPLQQLWVAAIKNDPQPGQDPSCVPYWLPGQSVTAKNISAFWAPKACRLNGDECKVGADCCSTVCSMGKCQVPPPELCRKQNQTCGGAGDCCAGLTCDPMTHICDGTIG